VTGRIRRVGTYVRANTYRVLVGVGGAEGRRPLGRPSHRLEDDINLTLKKQNRKA